MGQVVGVLAVQGDYAKHLEVLVRIGAQAQEVRSVEDLDHVERLIIPGGESTTVGILLQRFGLGEAIVRRVRSGMPVWGTCMGLILLAREVEGRDQWTLGLLDVKVRRNAFGAQVHSFEDSVKIEGWDEPVLGVFIRAPVVVELGPDVQAFAHYQGQIVGVRQGLVMGTSFHPELTSDARIHQEFVSK
jgi:5'-phosphate synthase pdxT subunit